MVGVSFHCLPQAQKSVLSAEQHAIINAVKAHKGTVLKGEGRYTNTQVISHIGIYRKLDGSLDLVALPLNDRNKDYFLIHPLKLTEGFPEVSERKNYGKIDKRRINSACVNELIRSYNIDSVSGGLINILEV